MAHEIEAHDNVVLHREAAWHGLGIVVQDAPTPREALKIAGLDWDVEQWAISATNGENLRIAAPDHLMNVRSDIQKPLGVVSRWYRPIQNRDLADFCELLAEQGDTVKIESAGSIRNGSKVWFLLKGESFSVRGKDEVAPYILVSNGHDGNTALRCTATSVRVVCSNTLHMVIPQFENGRVSRANPASFVANHIGDVKEKVAQAKAVLGLYGRSLDATREMIDAAAAKDVTREDVQRFFLECYTRDFGPIPSNAANKSEERKREKAMDAFNAVVERFDAERLVAGATAWNAMNAYTGWMQSDRVLRKDVGKERERRIASKLLGEDGDRASQTLVAALSI